jgi:hypothetical protein
MVSPWLGTVDPRAEGEALPCAQIALVLSVLGTVGIGAILSMGGVIRPSVLCRSRPKPSKREGLPAH